MRRQRRASNLQRLKGMAGSVDLRIDELILYGLHVSDRHALGDALSYELTRLLETDNAHSTFGKAMQTPTVHADRITVAHGARPASIGTQVARSVYHSLNTPNGEGGP